MVPTGVTSDTPAHFWEACHQALLCDNPSYHWLCVTQLPSWVCKPDGYLTNSSSSLVITFENPNSSTLSSLLTQRYLFAFGTQLPIHKWCQPPHIKAHLEAAQQKHVKAHLVQEAHARYASMPQIPVSGSPLPDSLDPSHLGGCSPSSCPGSHCPGRSPSYGIKQGSMEEGQQETAPWRRQCLSLNCTRSDRLFRCSFICIWTSPTPPPPLYYASPLTPLTCFGFFPFPTAPSPPYVYFSSL